LQYKTSYMQYTNLGNTDIQVSKICLGTMTWGEQNTEAEGHQQLDYALSKGVNFIDTAEMYSVPGRKETQGSTEKIIGSWIKKRGRRDDFILATKVTGPSTGLKHIRNPLKFTRDQIRTAIEGSLKRLQTDFVDLYQLHWPERKTNFFGKLGYEHDDKDPWQENFKSVLEVLNELQAGGKIRYFGISNETPYGLHKFLKTAEDYNLPRCVSVQNPYSLLNRTYEIGMAEMSIRENVGLLAYSPLAFGMLSGKYLNAQKPEKSRLSLFPKMSRYSGERSYEATRAYVEIAGKFNVDLATMALAWVNTRPFVTSNIIGATSMDQLKQNIDSIKFDLSKDMVDEIQKAHHNNPNPAP
jgi:aryl-alcohol dehydrogenase-like predicted oxidoreductase